MQLVRRLTVDCGGCLARFTYPSATKYTSGSFRHASGNGSNASGPQSTREDDVKFNEPEGSPSSGELYGREDRDPVPSPNPGVTQATSAEVNRNRGPGHDGSTAPGGTDQGVAGSKAEGLEEPAAYPIQNDPSVTDGAGPEVTPQVAEELQQDESAGPKAAGQGVVETLAKDQSNSSDRSGPA